MVDIEFDAYDDPRKKMYNEVFPCIFEPKSKVPVSSRRVYQLLSTMTIGKRGDVLKFKVTEKTHATLLPKETFPMFIDHIHFFTTRAGWKIANVQQYYTFKQESFKKEYILRNQESRQAEVGRDNDVLANFWKLLNNANLVSIAETIPRTKVFTLSTTSVRKSISLVNIAPAIPTIAS